MFTASTGGSAGEDRLPRYIKSGSVSSDGEFEVRVFGCTYILSSVRCERSRVRFPERVEEVSREHSLYGGDLLLEEVAFPSSSEQSENSSEFELVTVMEAVLTKARLSGESDGSGYEGN